MADDPVSIRSARPDEADEIDALLAAAFAGGPERDLVRALRTDSDMWAELVIPWQGGLAAYAALSRMRSPVGWAALAPLAVRPDLQRGRAAARADQREAYRFGSRLAAMIAGLPARTAASSPEAVVVLGDVAFYERAGFSAARAARLRSPYPIASTLIAAPGKAVPTADLVYPAAFDRMLVRSDGASHHAR